MAAEQGTKIIARNKRARHDYAIEDVVEAGLVLTGTEVKSLRAGRASLDEVRQYSAVVFGEGDFRTRTESRAEPPALNPGDQLELGRLRATVVRLLNHPRFTLIRFEGSSREIWEGLARHGRPIQYSHVSTPLAVWDTWTPIAGPPVAF